MEGHRLVQTLAYGDLGSEHLAVIGPVYQRQAEPVIELQLEKRRKAGLPPERRFERQSEPAYLWRCFGAHWAISFASFGEGVAIVTVTLGHSTRPNARRLPQSTHIRLSD